MQAALAGETPERWYAVRPVGAGGWRTRVDHVRRAYADGSWLQRLAPAFGGGKGPAADRLTRVATAGGVLVTTGQQPGLFGGPIYTWSKALTALAFADVLQEETGVPTAPVFWAATDDADFAEASWTMVAVPGGADTIRVEAAGRIGAPLAYLPLGEVDDQISRLRRAAGSAAFPQPLAQLRETYRTGATVGAAYVALVRHLLDPLGVSVLDAADESVRTAAFPLLREALLRAPTVAEASRLRAEELKARGFRAQVRDVAGLTTVFEFGRTGKRRIRLTECEAMSRKATAGGLSPNVLLRPVVERAILPTCAYVGGPGEIAYFAQASAVADALGQSVPLIVPRWSGTIVEPHIAKHLRNYRLTPDDLRDPYAAETRLARHVMPDSVRQALAAMRESIEACTRRLEGGADAPDERLVPATAVRGARRALEERVQRLERRYTAALKRREQDMIRDLATMRGALYPEGMRQERALNLLPLLARNGPTLLEGMLGHARDHVAGLI